MENWRHEDYQYLNFDDDQSTQLDYKRQKN